MSAGERIHVTFEGLEGLCDSHFGVVEGVILSVHGAHVRNSLMLAHLPIMKLDYLLPVAVLIVSEVLQSLVRVD